jgi:tetratricopeptide (TPR) repeat protein
MVGNLAVYLRLLVFPWPLKVYYPPVPPGLDMLSIAISSALVALCLFLSGKRHNRVGLLAASWILLFLLPVSGAVGLGLSGIAERFCYLPSVGLALVAGYVLGELFRKGSGHLLTGILTAGLFFLLAAGAFLHAGRWSDEVTFFSHAAASGPVSIPNIHFNLGNAYVDAGDPRSGIGAFEEAIRLNPRYTGAMLNLSSAHIKLGEPEKALDVLSRAIEIDPEDGRLWSNRGVVMELLGQTDEALKDYEAALELDAADPGANYHKGNLLQRVGRCRESSSSYRNVLEVEPDHLGALLGLGRSMWCIGSLEEAQEIFLNAVESHPLEPAPYIELGRVLLRRGEPAQAVIVYRRALEVAGPDPGVHRGLVLACYQAGRVEEAVQHIRGLGGTDPELSRELGDLVNSLGGKDDRDPGHP